MAIGIISVVLIIIPLIIIGIIMSEKHAAISPKSVFLHLLMIAMLYASMVAAITMLFQYVNLVFPDKLAGYYSYQLSSIYNSMNVASATLIIAFPVLVWVSWALEKGFRTHPENRNVRERRWLLFLTQFVTAITIIIDLITLVYTFYSGDVSTRFLLKVLAVLVVATFVLGYYYWDLHRVNAKSKVPMIVAIVSGVLILAALIGGFFIGASPQEQRAVRFDEQRVGSLSAIQSELVSYYQTKKALPEKLSDLNNSISGFTVPTDPDTNTAFEYTKKGDLSFELCATFSSKSVGYEKALAGGNVPDEKIGGVSSAGSATISYPGDPYGKNWLHTEGRFCYSRTIDPDYYKTIPVEKIPQ